jgi:hypothetical protein
LRYAVSKIYQNQSILTPSIPDPIDSPSFSGLYARALLLQHEGNPEKASKLIDGLLDTKLFNDKISLRQIISK